MKRHVKEAGTAWVRSLTRPKAAHTLYIARITAVEVYAAITRRQQGGYLSPAQAVAILGHFRRHLAQRYHVLELTPALFTDAMLYAFRQFHAPLEIYRGLQTVLIVSVSSRTAHRLLTASSCNAS